MVNPADPADRDKPVRVKHIDGGAAYACPHDMAYCHHSCVDTHGTCYRYHNGMSLSGFERYLPKNLSENRPESVNHPAHYGGDTVYETIKVCEAWGLDRDAYLFQTVKYISRAGKKTADLIEDLEKAEFYLKRRINQLKAEKQAAQTNNGEERR